MATKTLLSNDTITTALGLPKDIMDKVATAEGDTFIAAGNEVINAVNKIAYQKVEVANFSDPFKKYDGRPVTYGTTIENLFLNPPKGYKYDRNATDPFTKQPNTNKALYATLNYTMQYCVTIERAELKKAVLNEGGLMSIIDNTIQNVGYQSEIDTYEACVRMLNNPDIFADGFEEINVVGKTDAEIGEICAKKIKNVINNFKFPLTSNNKLRVKNNCPKKHALLIIKQDLLDTIDFDFLRGVYNLSKVDVTDNIITVNDFRTVVNEMVGGNETPKVVGEDLAFMIIDDRGFDNHPVLNDNGSIYNPKGKYFNQYSDLWKIFAYKYWFNARAFKLKTQA